MCRKAQREEKEGVGQWMSEKSFSSSGRGLMCMTNLFHFRLNKCIKFAPRSWAIFDENYAPNLFEQCDGAIEKKLTTLKIISFKLSTVYDDTDHEFKNKE